MYVARADKPLEYFAFAKMELSISLVPQAKSPRVVYRTSLTGTNCLMQTLLADLIEVS